MDLLDDVVFGDGVGTSIIQGNTASDNSTQFNVGGDMRLDLRVSKLQFLKQVAVHQHMKLEVLPEVKQTPLRQCFKSLAFPMMDYFANNTGNIAPETCEWLLRHRAYRSWVSRTGQMLCIKGNPGAGKSTLLRYALNGIKNTHNIGEPIFLLFDCAGGGVPGGGLQGTSHALFRSLLCQLLVHAPNAMNDLIAAFQRRREIEGAEIKWHPYELQHFFESALSKILESRSVWLFIDALYECRQTADDLAKNFRWLSRKLWSASNAKPFRSCFTCRHHPDLDFDNRSTILLDIENRLDIETFVRASLPKDYLDLNIDQFIIERSQGLFIWAQLALDKIRPLLLQKVSPAKIMGALNQTPVDINSLYGNTSRNTENPSATRNLMEWICFSLRPLTADELRWAMALDANLNFNSFSECEASADFVTSEMAEQRITALSCGLAEIVSFGNCRVVRFIHPSVREFLIGGGLSELETTTTRTSTIMASKVEVAATAHCRLSRACIRYLQVFSKSASPSEQATARYPLLRYATTSWIYHAKQGDVAETAALDLLYMFEDPCLKSWETMYQIIDPALYHRTNASYNLVHLAASYGLTKILLCLLQDSDIADKKDKHGQTPLSHAAENGHEVIVQLLLNTGKVNVNAKNNVGFTPLAYAANNGHVTVVKLLLSSDNVDVDSGDNYNNTPLSRAVEQGHVGVADLLINTNKVGINARDTVYKQTPLMRAARKGYKYVIDLLLRTNKVVMNARDNSGRTALSHAAEDGHATVVRQLLDTEQVDLNAADTFYGQTPLSRAAWKGHKDVVELLINTGRAKIDARDKNGQTPLSLAAENGHESVVSLLLSTGNANVNSKDNFSQTPLLLAAENGNSAVAKIFFRTANVDFAARNKDGQTALFCAAKNGHEAVVRLLLKAGQADVRARDKNGHTPQSQAAQNGHTELVRLLVAADNKGSRFCFKSRNDDAAMTIAFDTINQLPAGTAKQDSDREMLVSKGVKTASDKEFQGFARLSSPEERKTMSTFNGPSLQSATPDRSRSPTLAASMTHESVCHSTIRESESIVAIEDRRWFFGGARHFPKPRHFQRVPRRYRANKRSTMPLDLHLLAHSKKIH